MITEIWHCVVSSTQSGPFKIKWVLTRWVAAGCFHPILAGASIERWWGGLSGPRAGVYKANSCVIVSRAWENVPLAGRWRDLTPEPLVKKDLCAPRQHCDANEAPARCWTWCWLFFFLSLERFFFPFSFFFLFSFFFFSGRLFVGKSSPVLQCEIN